VQQIKLEVEYQKVEARWKSLKFVIAMDVCELIIAIEHAKQVEKENENFDMKFPSQANDLKKSIKTIEHLQLNVQKLSSSYHHKWRCVNRLKT
jgi:hypothetical protein